MAVIKSENFDGVTAPAIPAGWTVAAGYQTETTAFASSPNGLANTNANTNIAYWNTNDDGNGGDAQASAAFLCTGFSGTGVACYVFCRMATASTLQSGITSYVSQLHFSGGAGQVFLRRLNGGVATSMGTIAGITVSTSDTYRVYCITVGTSIILRVQRASDGKWLDNTGAWQTGQQDAISVTSSGAGSISGAGKAGVAMFRNNIVTDFVYSDDFLFENTIVTTRRRCSSTLL